MTCQCSPALLTLRNQVDAAWPHRDRASDGCCGDAAHAARKSDHNPVGGYAHAYDFDEDFTQDLAIRAAAGGVESPLWHFGLSLLADPRCKYLIYERRILYPDGRNNAYNGINAHNHHLHLSIHDGDTFNTTPWRITFYGPIPTTPNQEIDDMTNEQFSAHMAELVRIRDNTQRIDNRLSNVEKTLASKDGKPAVRTV